MELLLFETGRAARIIRRMDEIDASRKSKARKKAAAAVDPAILGLARWLARETAKKLVEESQKGHSKQKEN